MRLETLLKTSKTASSPNFGVDPKKQAPDEQRLVSKINGATDGTRTRDNLNHNQGLYQLSYGHQLGGRETRKEPCESKRRF